MPSSMPSSLPSQLEPAPDAAITRYGSIGMTYDNNPAAQVEGKHYAVPFIDPTDTSSIVAGADVGANVNETPNVARPRLGGTSVNTWCACILHITAMRPIETMTVRNITRRKLLQVPRLLA